MRVFLTSTLSSISAIFSQFPCLGVLRNLKRSHSDFAFDNGIQTWGPELQEELKDKNLKWIAMLAQQIVTPLVKLPALNQEA